MPRSSVAVALLLFIVAAVPASSGQGYVDGCSQQCHPQDADVNPGAAAEGDRAVNVIMYARVWEPADPLQGAAEPQVPLVLTPPGVDEDRTTAAGPTPYASSPASPVSVGEDLGIALVPASRLLGGSVPMAPQATVHWGLQGPLNVADGPLVLYWYVSAEAAASVQETKVGAVPQAQIDVHLTDADGVTLARQLEGPAMLVSRPGADNVYEYRVPLMLQPGATVLDGAFRLGVRLIQEEAPDADAQTPGWRIHWGPKWLPRLIVPLQSPLATENDRVYVSSSTIFVRWTVSSAFGWADVANGTAAARVVDADGVVLPAATLEFIGERAAYYDKDRREVVNLTWRVDPVALRGHEPPFRVETSIENGQGTYVLRDHSEIHFSHIQGASTTPGAGSWATIVAFLAGLGAAAAAVRRR